MSCDQSTFSDSVLCSRKLPAVWKNFFGTIGARSRVSASAHALAGLVGAAALEVLAHRRHVEDGDLLAVEHADPALALAERHQLHRRPPLSHPGRGPERPESL